MLTPNEAAFLIDSCNCPFSIEQVKLAQAVGRILAQSICADSDFPPFDQVRMDGIAIRYADWQGGLRNFSSIGIQRAGVPAIGLTQPGTCVEVMTGSILPHGADTVIPYEDTHSDERAFSVTASDIQFGKNIHRKGSDKLRGDLVIAQGVRIGSPEMGIAASSGYEHLEVRTTPRVAIVSTGDELVEIGSTPLPHQIRRSNVHALHAFMSSLGANSSIFHVNDEQQLLVDTLAEILDNNDLVILSGGVSRGKFDLVPDVLAQLGANCVFHRVAQKPGKPMWFGTRKQTVIFALPGNPISTLSCAARYILPWWRKNEGVYSREKWVRVIGEQIPSKSLTLFHPAKLSWNGDSTLSANLIPWNGSGDFSALAGADGFVQIEPDSDNRICSFWPLNGI